MRKNSRFRITYVSVLFLAAFGTCFSVLPAQNLKNLEEQNTEQLFTPSVLEEVQFPEVARDEWDALLNTLKNQDWETGLEKIRYFLFFHSEEFVPKETTAEHRNENGTETRIENETEYRTEIKSENDSEKRTESIPAACVRLLKSFPPEMLVSWRKIADLHVESVLQPGKSVPSERVLRLLMEQTPCSSYELELLELRAQLAWNSGNPFLARELWEEEIRAVNNDGKTVSCRILKRLPTLEELQLRLESAKNECESRNEAVRTSNLPKGWRVTMTQVLDPQNIPVFDDFLPPEQRGTLFWDRKRNETAENQDCPQLQTFSSDGSILAARLGTHVTFWPAAERATRPQAYIAAFDLHRDGALLWMTTPENPQRQFVGNPLADDTYVYIPSVQEIGNSRLEAALDVYAITDGTFQSRRTLFCARLPEPSASPLFIPITFTPEKRIAVGEYGVVER